MQKRVNARFEKVHKRLKEWAEPSKYYRGGDKVFSFVLKYEAA